MKIITAANKQFEPILSLTLQANLRAGYNVEVCPIPHMPPSTKTPEGKIKNVVGLSPWKPRVIYDALCKTKENLAWIDADAWVIRSLKMVDLRYDYDVAVTMRRQADRGRSNWPEVYGYLNAGVIFFRPSDAARFFVCRWEHEVERTTSNSDQHGLNNLVRHVTDLTEYNKIFTWNDVRILVLPTDEYNWVHLPDEPLPTTKILHCKSDLRKNVNLKAWTERTWPD